MSGSKYSGGLDEISASLSLMKWSWFSIRCSTACCSGSIKWMSLWWHSFKLLCPILMYVCPCIKLVHLVIFIMPNLELSIRGRDATHRYPVSGAVKHTNVLDIFLKGRQLVLQLYLVGTHWYCCSKPRIRNGRWPISIYTLSISFLKVVWGHGISISGMFSV